MARTRSGFLPAENAFLLLGSVVFALVLLAALEGVLRLTGLGREDASGASRLKYQQIYLPVLKPSTRSDGTPILHTADHRLPYQSIAAQKSPETLRVFTFGGSATAGLGYSPNVTFSRHLERMLEQAYPDRHVELVNLGIVALSSEQVKLLFEDVCRNYAPDLMIVYSGNNEFLEIHAEKYAEANANSLAPLLDTLLDTNLYRFVNRALRGGPRTPSLAEQDMSHDDLRLTQDAIIRDIEMTPAEVEGIVTRYRSNILRMADAAHETRTPMILMTVASNWKWRGREDLPAGWLDGLLGDQAAPSPQRYRRAIRLLGEQLEHAAPEERWELLYKRAAAYEAIGDLDRARDDYRSSMNEDPHLRRALDSMADGVREVGRERAIEVLDTIEVLASGADHGIVGSDEFYDYVHFTPEGAVRVAAALFDAIRRIGIAGPDGDFDPREYVERQLAKLDSITEDALAIDEWMGIGFDPGGSIADRDLWKYDRMLETLDQRIEADSGDFRALVYRANAHSFRVDGADRAARDYRKALDLRSDAPDVIRNLDRLMDSGRLARASRRGG